MHANCYCCYETRITITQNILFSVLHKIICAAVFYGKCKEGTTSTNSWDPFAATKQNPVDVFGRLVKKRSTMLADFYFLLHCTEDSTSGFSSRILAKGSKQYEPQSILF